MLGKASQFEEQITESDIFVSINLGVTIDRQ